MFDSTSSHGCIANKTYFKTGCFDHHLNMSQNNVFQIASIATGFLNTTWQAACLQHSVDLILRIVL